MKYYLEDNFIGTQCKNCRQPFCICDDMKVEKDQYMRRQETIPDIIKKFENGKERYDNDPMFYQVVQLLAGGTKEIKIIDDLLKINNKKQQVNV